LLDPRGVEQGPDFEFVASLRLLFLLAGFEPLMVSLATWLCAVRRAVVRAALAGDDDGTLDSGRGATPSTPNSSVPT
jgi:hypothetical protein